MPYIKQKKRAFILKDRNLEEWANWLRTVPVEQRKGFVAYIVNYIGKYSFTDNYFGKSTGLDAVRSAYEEMKIELQLYEYEKKMENGDV